MIGVSILTTSSTLIFCRYTVQYNRQERYIQLYKSTGEPSPQQKYHQLYGSVEITTRGPPLGRSRFTGTKGPFLTPAPVVAIPEGNFSTLKSGVPKIIHQTWENASVPSQVQIIPDIIRSVVFLCLIHPS